MPPIKQNNVRSMAETYYPYPPPNNISPRSEVPEDLAQVLATGRRSHKLSQNSKEAVWPVKLEATLIKALKAYAQSGACTRPAKRHPKRNRFISDFITQETAVIRSPKQIGSRLQQLKETCPDPEIQRLINQLGNGEPTPHIEDYNCEYTLCPEPTYPQPSISPHCYTSRPAYYHNHTPQENNLGEYHTGYDMYTPTPGFYIPPPPFIGTVCQEPNFGAKAEAPSFVDYRHHY